MKLLSPEVGWAASHHNLFLTADGGRHWKNISPTPKSEGNIWSTFFLDRSIGWVLREHLDEAADEPKFDLASTTNGGASWTTRPVKIDFDPERTTLMGGGQIDFLDSLHGWMNLPVSSSANFRLGILLMTTDGGRTWNWVPKSPGVSGTVHFVTLNDGWLAGGPGNQELYVTHDGSKSWQKVLLKAPFATEAPVSAIYEQPPVFEDKEHAFLPVTFSGPEGTGSKLALFASNDAGRNWKLDRELSISDEGTEAVPSTVVGSTWISASLHEHGRLTLTTVAPGGGTARADATVAPADSAVFGHSFITAAQGWALTSEGLLSTTNGGVNWINITPSAQPFSRMETNQSTVGESGDLNPSDAGCPMPSRLCERVGVILPTSAIRFAAVFYGENFDRVAALVESYTVVADSKAELRRIDVLKALYVTLPGIYKPGQTM